MHKRKGYIPDEELALPERKIPKIQRDVRRMVVDHCANFDCGRECLLERPTGPIGDHTCEYWKPWRHQFGEHQCNYFIYAVLPNDPKLEEIYYRSVMGREDFDSGKTGTCEKCGSTFAKRSNRQKHCPTCRVEVAKEKKKRRNKRYYESKQKNSGN